MKKFKLEFGDDTLSLSAPVNLDILEIPGCAPQRAPAESIRESLLNPIGSVPLPELIESAKQRNPEARAVIVISDNTRPVPYTGEQGILEPVLDVLTGHGIRRIEILVANGTHRALPESELKRFLPARVFGSGITLTNHVCTDKSMLKYMGRTSRGSEIWLNRRYLDADIKILTGLVEPHFMAGVSGGRKSICPGLAGEELTHIFHGALMMDDERADSLILDGNPCHEEALEAALAAGSDFIINATINGDRRLTGVYSGDMVKAHEAAARRVIETNAIPINREYDLIITHAGFVGINHYQAAKACVEAVKAVRPDGTLVVAANHTDPDPIGSANYKSVIPMLKKHGPRNLSSALLAPDWAFVPEQWEVQMWARVLKKLRSSDHLVYCAPRLTGELFKRHSLPGVDGGGGIPGLSGIQHAEKMVQRAIDRFIAEHPDASAAVLAHGPYGTPTGPRP